NRVMTALGPSGAFTTNDARFYAAPGASGGHDADDRVVFDTSSGNLWYDADGSGSGAAQLIATVQTFGAAASVSASDIVVDGTSTPTPTGSVINGTEGNDSLVGGAGADTIFGFGGNDTIDGGAGADSMIGGPGDDVYYVDNSSDVIVEQQSDGLDEVRSSADYYALSAWVNDITLIGAGRAAEGNDLDNVITGNAGDNNALYGHAGNDTINGGDGADVLEGNQGDDMLSGGLGIDNVRGAEGADTYIFDVAPGAA